MSGRRLAFCFATRSRGDSRRQENRNARSAVPGILSRRDKLIEVVCEPRLKPDRFPRPEGAGKHVLKAARRQAGRKASPGSKPDGRKPPAAAAYFLAAFFAVFLADFFATFFATFFFAAFFLATVEPPNKRLGTDAARSIPA